MLLLGVAVSFALPRALNSSPERQLDSAARALGRDLDQLRMRAIAAKRRVRVSFDVAGRSYSAFMDASANRAGEIAETAEQVRESRLLTHGWHRGLPGVELPFGVRFSAGSATTGPDGAAVVDPVSLAEDRVEFDARGMVVPAGAGGIVYLSHEEKPAAVAAVTISGAGAFRTWRYRGGEWIK